jgi:hypothetical protein
MTKVAESYKQANNFNVKITREINANFKQKATQETITESEYFNTIQNIMGDSKQGISYESVINKTICYLAQHSFHYLNDSEYNLSDFKAILDTYNNKFELGYQPNILLAYNGNAIAKRVKYFKEAYALIQFDYYFKTIDFKNQPFYIYTMHYFNTGEQLPVEDYTGDKDYLLKEYLKMNKEGFHRAKYQIQRCFNGALFMLLNELQLPTIHFKNNIKDCREYNALTKTPREFRKFFPFKLLEFDINSAFPNFIDSIIDTNYGSDVYNVIGEVYETNRSESKTLFNKWLNSSKYKTATEFTKFFNPIYKEKTAALVDLLTNKEKPFWKVMFYWEYIAIETFIKTNNIERFTRLHDGIFIVDNIYSQKIRETDFMFANFSGTLFYSYPSISVAQNKKMANTYTPAIPFELKEYYVFEENLTGNINSERFGKFRIFREPFYYINANWNISSNGMIRDGMFEFYNESYYMDKLQNMVNVMAFKNNFCIKALTYRVKILLHRIQDIGVIQFDLEELLECLIYSIEEPKYKTKNYIYCGGQNITIPEFQSEYYKALRMYDLKAYASAIYPVIEKSYKKKEKLFIDLNELGIKKTKSLGNNEIISLINRFNIANGFTNDIRSVQQIKSIYKAVHDIAHPIYRNYNRVFTFVHNHNDSNASKELCINRRTYVKFKNWVNFKQDIKTITDIFYTITDIINNTIDYEITKLNDGRNSIKIKEDSAVKENIYTPFDVVWKELNNCFPNKQEFAIQMENSVLNKDEIDIVVLYKHFYKEWESFQYYNTKKTG